MNKKVTLSLALLLTVPFGLFANQEGPSDTYSHTFFADRPLFQSSMPEKISGFRNNRMDMQNNCWGGAFQMVFFGGRTTKGKGSKDLARFFMPFDKTTLLVVEGLEDATTPYIVRDIDPSNFNIATVDGDFQSTISFRPEQSYFGIGLDYMQAFSSKSDGSVGFWGEISFPITRVRNKVHLRENVTNDGGGVNPAAATATGAVANMTEAFKQPAFHFGRINNSLDTTKWFVADIELKLGYNVLDRDCYHVNSYIGVISPTSNKQRPKGINVFETTGGHRKHVGVMTGGNLGYECWSTETTCVSLEFDLTSKYFIRNCERRSFDVMDKQWSRYMQVYANATDAAAFDVTQGINVFTADVRVTPRFQFDYNTALVFENSWCNIEIGYNFFARQAEKVELLNFPFQPAFVDAQIPQNINPARTINHQFELKYPLSATTDYIPLTVNDLDLRSAAHPAMLTQTFYGAIGMDWSLMQLPTFTNIGASYEYSGNNNGMTRWNVFGKFGFAF